MKLSHLILATAVTSLATGIAFASPSIKEGVLRPDGWPFNGKAADLLDQQEQAERRQDPLRFLTSDMNGIVTDLSQYKTDKPVQVKQEKVVKNLDALIEELEKQWKGGGKAGGRGGGKPLQQSTIAGGPGGQGDMIDPKKGEKQWTNLLPKQREQILQSQTEGFPPGYENILQSYYRRLSQEQVNPDGSPAATPAPAAAPATPAPATNTPTTRPSAR